MVIGDLVTVVDDDESVRESLPALLRTSGYTVDAFSSAEAFLASGRISETKCLVLDVSMPGMSGPDLHRELKRRESGIPIVFITGNENRWTCEDLMNQGAAGCLRKPFDPEILIDTVGAALERG